MKDITWVNTLLCFLLIIVNVVQCVVCFFSCRGSPSRLIAFFRPTPPRSRCTTPRPSRLSKVGCDEPCHFLPGFDHKCCAALNLFMLFFFFYLVDVLCGYNGTIFAYGQTSSGKTHTMEVWKMFFFVVVVQLKCSTTSESLSQFLTNEWNQIV